MAHAFITGAQPSDSERDLHIGGVDSAPSGLFRLGDTTGTGPLSYVALGHLHSPQSVGLDSDPSIRYSGSPIAFSFSETRPKSSVLLHIAGSTVETEIIPAPIWRPIVTLEGTLTVLLEQAEKHRDSFVRCIVTDPSRPADLSARLRHAFPHALEIQHHPEGSLPVSTHPATRISPRLNPLDVVTTFMEQSGGTPLTPVEKHQLRDAWEATRKAEA